MWKESITTSRLKLIMFAALMSCIAFALATTASAVCNTEIDQVERVITPEDNGTITVSGTVEAVEGDSIDADSILYVATYESSGKMLSIAKAEVTDGSWTADELKTPGGSGAVRAFFVSPGETGYAPQAEKFTAAAVSSAEELSAALSNGDYQTVFITGDVDLTRTETLEISRDITVARGATVTVGSDYNLNLNSGAALKVDGTLSVNGNVAVHGSDYRYSGDNYVYTQPGGIIMRGGTLNITGTIDLIAAYAAAGTDYSGGEGGRISGDAGSIIMAASGLIRIESGYTDEEVGVYNQGATVNVGGFTVTGSGTIENNNNFILQGGSHIEETLQIYNRSNLNIMTAYNDDGEGNITVDPVTFSGDVSIIDDGGNIYEAAFVMTEAGLRKAIGPGEDAFDGENIEADGDLTLAGAITIPDSMTFRTFGSLTIASAGSLTVDGRFEQYGEMTIDSGCGLTVGPAGSVFVYANLGNAGTVTVYGVLYIGGDSRDVTFNNTGSDTLAIDETGAVVVEPGATLNNSGTVTGTVTVGKDSSGTGTVTDSGIATQTGRIVRSNDEFTAALADTECDWISVETGIEISTDLTVEKPFVVNYNNYLRIENGAKLTVASDLRLNGWAENNGGLVIGSGANMYVFNRFYNNGTLTVDGTADIYTGKIMKTYGTITIGTGGEVKVGGTIGWGSEAEMPTLGSGGYTDGDGRIVSTTQAANDEDGYKTLVTDDSCDNIEIHFNINIPESTRARVPKSLSISSGYIIYIPSGSEIVIDDGMWLNIWNGATLNNEGTITVSSGENSGHLVLDPGSTLYNVSGVISVYGEMQIQDEENSTITGKGNITYYHFVTKQDLALELSELLADYGLTAGGKDDYSATAYKDWDDMSDDYKAAAAFVLNNLPAANVTLWDVTGDGGTCLEPFNWITYGFMMDTLEALWDAVKNGGSDLSDLPEGVALGLSDDAYVSVHNYGPGSDFDVLMGKFMTAVGRKVIDTNPTYMVNNSDEAQQINYKKFTGNVTVTYDPSSGGADYIEFIGCIFDNPVSITSVCKNFRVVFNNCELNGGTDVSNDIAVLAAPGIDLFNNGDIATVQLTGGTTGVTVGSDCCVQADSFVDAGTFTLCGVTYTGAAEVGSSGFGGKYQIDDDGNGGTSISYHAGGWIDSVDMGTVEIHDFHLWDNAMHDLTLDLGGSAESCKYPDGGYFRVSDDGINDNYAITLLGAVGDVDYNSENPDATKLNVNLYGKVDISGLAVYNTDFYGEQESSVKIT
ncbi:MAG: hypothetical protein AB7C97_04205, partial [Oscillospiraceae bacterium]